MRPPKSKKAPSRKPSKNPHPHHQPRDHPKDTTKRDLKKTSSAAEPQAPSADDDLFSDTIPLTLQQLLLNVFKYALLYSHAVGSTAARSDDDVTISTDVAESASAGARDTATIAGVSSAAAEEEEAKEKEEEDSTLDTKSLIQTIKSHLYNRDFDSAFTDADDDLLRAYALRWSAARALGYAGLFRGLLGFYWGVDSSNLSFTSTSTSGDDDGSGGDDVAATAVDAPTTAHVVCLGGGAGAEIVALAAALRDMVDGISSSSASGEGKEKSDDRFKPSLAVTAVDIADWSGVVRRLDSAVRSDDIPSGRSHRAPLVGSTMSSTSGQREQQQQQQEETKKKGEIKTEKDNDFQVRFRRADVLSISDEELKGLLYFGNDNNNTLSLDSLSLNPTTQREKTPTIITLMFTLNELFSTSMAKATSLLLRVTDLVHAGSLLLVVDSPGSYSTLRLARRAESDGGEAPERRYPMKFLLDHTLLSVAGGKWERVYSRDSRWWRREASRLSYEVGEGAGLEDMRFQVHLYRRL